MTMDGWLYLDIWQRNTHQGRFEGEGEEGGGGRGGGEIRGPLPVGLRGEITGPLPVGPPPVATVAACEGVGQSWKGEQRTVLTVEQPPSVAAVAVVGQPLQQRVAVSVAVRPPGGWGAGEEVAAALSWVPALRTDQPLQQWLPEGRNSECLVILFLSCVVGW